MFYVYEWYIKDTNEIIYVGKGTKRRYLVTKHNRFFNNMIKRYNCESRIIKEFNTEKEAFDYEYLRINELKEQNQCVCNIRKGGYGGSVEWWTDEIRQNYSEKNVMKSEIQRKRMSEKNPMKNHDIAMKVGKTKRRPVIIDGVEYDTVKSAAQQLNVCNDTIQKWCIDGINQQNQKCSYKDGIIKHYKKRTRQSAAEPNETN